MARPLRIELSGGLYHVTARGDRQEDIYLGDDDRRQWLAILAHVCQRFNWVCHAWCQMSNHYHLVVETPDANLSAGMRQLNGVYTQWFNRTHQRVGHVYQGRFKGIMVEKDSYLLELARYVVLNPVRAGMVKDTVRWPWSSYHEMIGKRDAPEWLQTDWVLAQFGAQRQRAITKYMEFVREGIKRQSPWQSLQGQIYLGSEKFVAKMQKQAEKKSDLRDIPRAQRRPLAKPLAYYEKQGSSRDDAIANAYATGDYTLQEIANHFNLHYATISRVIKRKESE
jgi:REP element-mobilizing transposase RayT